MDYKKKYKDALERAKGFHTPDSNNSNLKAVLELIFPELAESDDEKIMTELIGYLTHRAEVTAFIEENKDCKRWIAYLEKQKVNTDGDFARGYDCGYENCLHSHGAEWLEKQKEQKPAEWSEEDETRLKVIKEELERYIMFSQYSTPLSVDDINWLKSLPERFNLQSKQEWSEEDEHRREGVVEWLRDHQKTIDRNSNNQAYESIESLISWLKSLRPQSHWKSSEEQHGVESLTKLEKEIYDMLVERTNEGTISEKQARKYAPMFLAIAKDEILGNIGNPPRNK